MRAVRLTFGTLATAGLLLSLLVHVSTFLGGDPIGVSPLVMLLHLGIFVVCLPAFYFATREPRAARHRLSRDELKHAPRWLLGLSGFFFAYGIVNFVIFFFLQPGSPHQRPDGTYYLSSHGRLLREI